MTSDEEPPRIVPFDTGTPSAARIYDAYLGGRDHFPVDQEFAERVMREIPTARPAALANRACLGRMVRWLADQGIEQFIDLGAGLPMRAVQAPGATTVAQHGPTADRRKPPSPGARS